MRNSRIILAIFLLIFSYSPYSYSSEDLNNYSRQKIDYFNRQIDESPYEKAVLSALALNYCRFSLAKIRHYKDKMVIDEEYRTIVDRINLEKISDKNVVRLITKLMEFMKVSFMLMGVIFRSC